MFNKLKVVVLSLLGGLFLFSFSTTSIAIETRQVIINNVSCIRSESVSASLHQEGEEVLLFGGVLFDNKAILHIFINKETTNWSIVIFNSIKVMN